MEGIAPPRGLWCDFPLGRPLGIPNNPQFQHRVLASAFAMLMATEPTFEMYGEAIHDDGTEVASCSLPPRHDAEAHPAVDEARGLRNAYDRAIAQHGNRMGAGRVVGADGIADAIEAFVRVADGMAWKEAGIPGIPARVSQDIRGYYETAALALVDHAPSAWAGTRWFFDQTEAGKVILGARKAIADSGAKQPVWLYMAPGDQ